MLRNSAAAEGPRNALLYVNCSQLNEKSHLKRLSIGK